MAVLQKVGQDIMQWSERLAQHSEPGWAEKGQLTVTYLTPAHLAVAAELKALMQEAGFDEIFRRRRSEIPRDLLGRWCVDG
jgi:hypothetical protein